MLTYQENDYKEVIRTRARELGIPLKKLASKIEIQHTYLSRILNSESAHLSEDHLFLISQLLELVPEEIEFLSLLRARAASTEVRRRKYLDERINHVRQAKAANAGLIEYDARKLSQEMAFLLDPWCMVILISLNVPAFRESPRELAPHLGLTLTDLKDRLKRLRDLGFIELGDNAWKVQKVLRPSFQYSTDHPLMRTHQALLKQLCQTRLGQTPEDKKRSLMVTFTTDEESFKKILADFQDFLKGVERTATRGKDQGTYQLNFDLFKWF